MVTGSNLDAKLTIVSTYDGTTLRMVADCNSAFAQDLQAQVEQIIEAENRRLRGTRPHEFKKPGENAVMGMCLECGKAQDRGMHL